MVDFTRSAALAKRLVEKHGRSVTLYKENRDPSDPALPWQGNVETPHLSEGGAQFPILACFVPVRGAGLGTVFANREAELAINCDQVCLVASDSIPAGYTFEDVENADKVRDGDRVWSIVIREHLRPATKSVLFALGLKA